MNSDNLGFYSTLLQTIKMQLYCVITFVLSKSWNEKEISTYTWTSRNQKSSQGLHLELCTTKQKVTLQNQQDIGTLCVRIM